MVSSTGTKSTVIMGAMTQRNPCRASNTRGEGRCCPMQRSRRAMAGQGPQRRPRPLSTRRVPWAGRPSAPPGSGLDPPARHHARRPCYRTERDADGHRARAPLPASEPGATRDSARCRMRQHLWRGSDPDGGCSVRQSVTRINPGEVKDQDEHAQSDRAELWVPISLARAERVVQQVVGVKGPGLSLIRGAGAQRTGSVAMTNLLAVAVGVFEQEPGRSQIPLVRRWREELAVGGPRPFPLT